MHTFATYEVRVRRNMNFMGISAGLGTISQAIPYFEEERSLRFRSNDFRLNKLFLEKEEENRLFLDWREWHTFPINLAGKMTKLEIKRATLTPTQSGIDPKLVVTPHSIIKGAIPVLHVYLAMICFVLNVFVPGLGEHHMRKIPKLSDLKTYFLGTILSGFFCLFCIGIPRFSDNVFCEDRIGAFIVNIFIGITQVLNVHELITQSLFIFCLGNHRDFMPCRLVLEHWMGTDFDQCCK